MQVIMAHEKHDTYPIPADNLEEAALMLVTERLDGYYDNWNDGDPAHQWQDRAEKIIADHDGKAAWNLLMERRGHEYEYIELRVI